MKPLRGRRVVVDEAGELGRDRVLRAWWRGGRPVRVLLRARGPAVVHGSALPGEVLRGRWVLVLGEGDDGRRAR